MLSKVTHFSIVALVAGVLASCRAMPPSSVLPGRYSATTGLSLVGSGIEHLAMGINDFDVLTFHPGRCPDTLTIQKIILPPALRPMPQAPGILLINNNGIGIDEAEVSNLEWKVYQYYHPSTGFGAEKSTITPAALPLPTYFTDPFYNRFPVVGVSYEQVLEYCRWRSRVVTSHYNREQKLDSLHADYARYTYRLPSEAEWESALRVAGNKPYGISCIASPLTVNPAGAAYLKRRSGSSLDVRQVKADIVAYNKTKPERTWINYQQAEPYFLRLTSPGYVWQGPPNDFGLYQMLGNAAEMVQEEGVTKGGSYLDPLAACTVQARGRYEGPAPHIGFRCVCEVSFPNRR